MKAIFGDIIFTEYKSNQRWFNRSGNTNGIIDVYTPYKFNYEVLNNHFEVELYGENIEEQAYNIAEEKGIDYVIPDLFMSETLLHTFANSFISGELIHEFY